MSILFTRSEHVHIVSELKYQYSRRVPVLYIFEVYCEHRIIPLPFELNSRYLFL